MARPFKEGIDYFQLDVDLDDKFKLIEAEFGMEGFGTIIKLFQKIYKTCYFYDWTKKEQLLFARSVNVDINKVIAIINAAMEWKLFSKTMFNKHHILTSRGIQKRFFNAIKRREKFKVYQQYLLIDITTYKNLVIDNNNPINDDDGTQSRVEYNKNPPSPPFSRGDSQIFQNQESKPEPEAKPPDLKSQAPPRKAKGGNGEVYKTKRRKFLHGERLRKFREFVRVYAYPDGMAAAADAWLEIENFDEVYPKIISGAREEAKRRPEIKAKGQTPKMMQGWISGKRWEDFIGHTQSTGLGVAKYICKICEKQKSSLLAGGICWDCNEKQVESENKPIQLVQNSDDKKLSSDQGRLDE